MLSLSPAGLAVLSLLSQTPMSLLCGDLFDQDSTHTDQAKAVTNAREIKSILFESSSLIPGKYLTMLKDLQGRALSSGIDTQMVHSVFYPAAGSDSGLPFSLFPNAEVVFALDSNGFKPTAGMKYSLEEGESYRRFTEEENASQYSKRILGSLHKSIPNFRLKRVILFETQEIIPRIHTEVINWGTYQSHANHTEYDHETASHGIIEFDTGEGSAIRRYVHINAFLDDKIEFKKKWWYKMIDAQTLNGIIIKSAGRTFHPTSGESLSARAWIEQMLKKSRGILVQGKELFPYADTWEFGDLLDLAGSKSSVFSVSPDFGYGDKVRFSHF